MAVNPLLRLTSLGKSYSFGCHDVQVLDGIDLAINDGEFVVIMGQEGSGKSALLNILAGIERCSTGSVQFDGQELPVDGYSPSLLGLGVAFLSPLFSLDANDTIQQAMGDANLTPRLHPRFALELAGVSPTDNRKIGQLDPMTRRNVGTARALVLRPRLVLADLRPPPWGVAPSLASLAAAHAALGCTVVATSIEDVPIAQARKLTMAQGKIEKTPLTLADPLPS